MQMAERQAGAGSAASGSSRPALVGRDATGRFVGNGGKGARDGAARMKIAMSPEQRRWVEEEAARRKLPKTVIVRELLDQALVGGVPGGAGGAGGGGPVHDVDPDGAVHDVGGLEDAAAAAADAGAAREAGAVHDGGGVAGAGSGYRDPGAARVPEVEVVDAEPVAGGCAQGGGHGRHPHYHAAAVAAARAGAPPRGVRPYSDPSRREATGERVAVESVRRAVGDPSAGDGFVHVSQLPPGVGAPRPRRAPEPARSRETLEGLPTGVSLPGGMHADVVSEGAESRSLVVSGGAVSTESGVLVMLPGENPGDPPRAVRIPVASYVRGEHGQQPPAARSGFFSGVPRFLKYGLIVFCVISVLLGFVYLGSSFVANRYEFREVEVAPGRVIFYRVDRWTGEMERCRSSVSGYRDESDVAC